MAQEQANLRVQVVLALPGCQRVVDLCMTPGATAMDAVVRSQLPGVLSATETRNLRLGVYGREVGHDFLLRDGDRVEIYRPLQVDPKEARRRRACLKKDRQRA